MSDFFSDDFTAELKRYFLENLMVQITDNIDLIDDSIWMRIRSESAKQATEVWAVDARTNDFVYLAEWLEKFDEKTRTIQNASALKKYLDAVKDYVKTLQVERVDSAELAAKFSSLGESNVNILLLHCRFGEQNFAIPLLNVIEIVSARPLFPLPEKREGLLGVITFRGDVIPVISFQDHGFVSAVNDHICYVICELDGMRFSLQVNETDNLIKLRETDLQTVQNHSAMIQNSFVKQFYVHEQKNVMILDLNKLVA